MRFFVQQLLRLAIMLWGISLLSFGYLEIAQSVNLIESVNQPSYLSKYQLFISDMVNGNFGNIHQTGEPVLKHFLKSLPASMELMIFAIIFAWLFGLPIAILAVQKPMGIVDRLVQLCGTIIYSLPVFWWGLILLIVFSTGLEWSPVGGRLDYIYDIEPVTGAALIDTLLSPKSYALEAFGDAIYHMILPLIALTVLPTAYVALQIRASMEEILNSDYMRSARARGLSKSRLLWFHGLPNAIQPVMSSMSLQFAMLVTSLVIVEHIFSWPGIGHWFLLLIKQQDYPALRGALMLIATLILFLNMATDVLRYWTNPQLRR